MSSSVTASHAFTLLAILLASLLLHGAAAEWVEAAKLTDSDGEASDEFGWDVAIDNGILVVGAHYDDVGGLRNAGSVTILELSDGAWVAQQNLTASDAEAEDYFGYSVTVSNGVVAVGAFGEDEGGSRAGAVYIYEKGADGAWTERQKLTHNDAAAGDRFGFSLAMHGNTLIVGADSDDSFSGSVYVYTLSAAGTLWTQAAKLTARDRSAGDLFGNAVAIDAETILVGARQEDDLGGNSGSAYVFQRDGQGGSWTQVAKLTPADGRSLDEFGRAVALEGGTIFVGSFNNADGENVGAVYQYGKDGGGTWTPQNKLVARDSVTNASFGSGLAVRNDTLVVGAYGQNSSTGAVYVFQQESDDVWTQRAKQVASDGSAGDRFGNAVAVADGMIITGAWGDNSLQGSVYAFEWRASETDARPSAVPIPTMQPSQSPSVHPLATSSIMPSVGKSKVPTSQPTSRPTEQPTATSEQPAAPLPTPPSLQPLAEAFIMPSVGKSKVPTSRPTRRPTEQLAATSEQPAAPLSTPPPGGLQLNMVVLVVGIAFVTGGVFAVLIYSRRNNRPASPDQHTPHNDHPVVIADNISELEDPSVGKGVLSVESSAVSMVHSVGVGTASIDHSQQTSVP